jgi:arginyl-tRNA synthetase
MDHLIGLKEDFVRCLAECFGLQTDTSEILINETRREFAGDFTFVLFTYVKQLKKSPAELGTIAGDWLIKNSSIVDACEVVQGFLNVTMSDAFWLRTLNAISSEPSFGESPATGKKVMVEFASPNTNKPLHLGHIRNILLGWSCARILEANGYQVITTQVINDRGIAICKSMLAWQKFGNGATPASTGIKGDHLVGDYYVLFEQTFREEYEAWQRTKEGIAVWDKSKKAGQEKEDFFKEYKNTYFNDYSRIGGEARQMLLDWEAGKPEVTALWKQMNSWVYEGFDQTYTHLGVHFDCAYYESETYLLGKKAIEKGLDQGIFYRLEDGSVWVNLEDAGMDRKILLRSDGTSVYMTQDIGTAQKRYADYGIDRMVYTVADEQDYHFKVLFEILRRLGEPYAAGLHHLSYGMVELPTGRMKSREGTVVDADDLIAEVIAEASSIAEERGEIAALPAAEQKNILRQIGLGALKFFMIRIQPRKRMIFDPKESVDMQGQTGPYVQNAYVRIQSVIRKSGGEATGDHSEYSGVEDMEKVLIRQLMQFPSVVREAGDNYDPSAIANFAYVLARDYHRFYHDVRILNAPDTNARNFRITLSGEVGKVLKKSFYLLGIEMPDRM